MINQEYHSFKVSFASMILSDGKSVGVDNAIFLQDIAYWCDYNRSSGTNFEDGRYWTYGTMDTICERHPYWTKKQVRRIIERCKETGLLLVGNYNKSSYDRTLWYSVSDDVLEILGLIEKENPCSKIEKSKCPNGQMENPERDFGVVDMGRPIPYNKTIYNKKIDKPNTVLFCAEPTNGQMEEAEPPVISFPLNDGTDYPIIQSVIDKWAEIYPAVDIIKELRKMKGWLIGNPTKKKTKRGIGKFINNWLSNAQDNGGSSYQIRQAQNEDRSHKKSFYELAIEMEENGEI